MIQDSKSNLFSKERCIMQQGCDRSYLNQRSQCFLLSICCTFIFQKSNQQKFLGLSRPANSVLTGFILVSLLYFIQTFIYLFIIFYIIVVVFFFANALLLFSVLLHDQFFPRLFLSLIGIIVVFRLLARSVRKKKKKSLGQSTHCGLRIW